MSMISREFEELSVMEELRVWWGHRSMTLYFLYYAMKMAQKHFGHTEEEEAVVWRSRGLLRQREETLRSPEARRVW